MAYPPRTQSEFAEQVRLFTAPHWGTVVDPVDPLKLQRVRVAVPTLFTEPRWAYRWGAQGRGQQQGIFAHAPPAKGSTVIVGFILGDVDEPYYVPASAGQGNIPAALSALSAEDAAKSVVIETPDFLITIITSAASKALVVESRTDNDLYVRMDANTRSVEVNAPVAITLKAPKVKVDAQIIELGNRVVSRIGDPTI